MLIPFIVKVSVLGYFTLIKLFFRSSGNFGRIGFKEDIVNIIENLLDNGPL